MYIMKVIPTACRWFASAALLLAAATAQTVVLEEVVSPDDFEQDTTSDKVGKHDFMVYGGLGYTPGQSSSDGVGVDPYRRLSYRYGFGYRWQMAPRLALLVDLNMASYGYRLYRDDTKPYPMPDSVGWRRQFVQHTQIQPGIGLRLHMKKATADDMGIYLDAGCRLGLPIGTYLITRTSDGSNGDDVRLRRDMSDYAAKAAMPVAMVRLGFDQVVFTFDYLLGDIFDQDKLPAPLPKLAIMIEIHTRLGDDDK